jgi:hypothetical protein
MGKMKELYINAYESGIDLGMDHDEADQYARESLAQMFDIEDNNSRYESNKKILEILGRLNEENPDQRFVQLLFNADILVSNRGEDGKISVENEYNTESEETLERLLNSSIVNSDKE